MSIGCPCIVIEMLAPWCFIQSCGTAPIRPDTYRALYPPYYYPLYDPSMSLGAGLYPLPPPSWMSSFPPMSTLSTLSSVGGTHASPTVTSPSATASAGVTGASGSGPAADGAPAPEAASSSDSWEANDARWGAAARAARQAHEAVVAMTSPATDPQSLASMSIQRATWRGRLATMTRSQQREALGTWRTGGGGGGGGGRVCVCVIA